MPKAPHIFGFTGGSVRAAVAGLLLLLLAVTTACARAETCGLCRREIHHEVRTVVAFADGRRVAACCPRCALHVARNGGGASPAVEVTDYAGTGTLPLDAAWLVDGSDETPCLRHHPPITAGEGTP